MPDVLTIRIILSFILLVVIIVILTRFRAGNSRTEARDSLAIMKERLDRGEITEEEYEEAKRKRGK